MSESNNQNSVSFKNKKFSMDENYSKDDSIVCSNTGGNLSVGSESRGEDHPSDFCIFPSNMKKKQTCYISKPYTYFQLFKSRKHVATLLIIGLLIFLLLFVALFVLSYIGIGLRRDLPCLDETCIKIAAEILSKLDQSVLPCENFYEYACNGWIKDNNIPQGHNTWSIMRKLAKSGEYFTKDLLENKTHTDIGRGFKLAQTYYKSCMNENLIAKRGFEPLYRYMDLLFGGWSLLDANLTQKSGESDATFKQAVNDSLFTVENFDLTDFYFKSFKYFGSVPLCHIGVGQDQMNSSRFVIEISEGFLSLQREYYINDSSIYSDLTNAFRRFMHKYTQLLGVPVDKMNEIDDIYNFEKQIALRTEERSEKDSEKDYELVVVGNLSSICPVMNWKKLLQALYDPLNYTITDQHTVALHDRKFFRKRCALYETFLKSNEKIKILYNSAVWSFLWKIVTKLPKKVTELLQEYREIESGLKIEPDRWQTCVNEVQGTFGNVIGRMFVKQNFDQKSKDAATEMISEIRQAFKQTFADVSWMEESDKLKAIEKVDLMKASVGYPKNIDDINEENKLFRSIVSMSESTYFENSLYCFEAVFLDLLSELITQNAERWVLPVHIVNAFYKENSNHIYFPAGILQSPLYHPDHPLSLNFGGIGMVVGHEITHAFDQHGAKFDAKGNMRDWWSSGTLKSFEKHSQCMINQYNNYSILNTTLNGKMTLGENIADNGGMKAAYRAFKKLEAKYTDKPKLPGLNFTPDQLFFIGFAQLWCVKSLPQSTLNSVLFDVHTVDQYRVIGTLSNSVEFSRVFNCPSGSFMNPKEKCQIW